MLTNEYSENQMTPWLRGTSPPACPGRYQLKVLGSENIVDGYFDGARWKLLFRGMTSPLSYSLRQIEWRGLNFEPPIEKRDSSGTVELVFDYRGP